MNHAELVSEMGEITEDSLVVMTALHQEHLKLKKHVDRIQSELVDLNAEGAALTIEAVTVLEKLCKRVEVLEKNIEGLSAGMVMRW